ncbi:MAG: glycosyltransferase family 4 protein [Candidatus Limimorpha sp.]
MRSKILYIANNIPTPTRKANDVIIKIAREMSKYHDITFLYPKEFAPFPINKLPKYKHLSNLNKPWETSGFNVNPISYIRIPGLRYSFSLLDLSKQKIVKYLSHNELPELVHAHYILPDGYFAFMIKQKYDIPYIVSVRGSDIKYMTEMLARGIKIDRYKDVIDHAAKVITHNEFQRKYIEQQFHKECEMIPHGVERCFLCDEIKKNDDNQVIIAFVGSLIKLKRTSWVIDAVKEYSGKKTVILWIIGDGEERQSLENQAKGSDNIIFWGQQPHEKVSELLRQTDIFAMPSQRETFGLVYIEAAASRNAVIAVKNTGVWGVLKEDEEACFISDYESFRKTLHTLIDNDEIRNSIARNAFEKTRDNLIWDKTSEKYEALYKQIIDNK